MGDFAERLKKLRDDRGITQAKLAKDLDIPEPSIRRLETSDGIPRKERLIQISGYFKVSIDYLLGKEVNDTLSDINETEEQKKIRETKERMVKTILDHNISSSEAAKIIEKYHNNLFKE